mgnify:CR=1 FL=1
MISRSTLSGATRIAIAMATARIALLKTQKISMSPMLEYMKMKIEKFNKIYYVFLEHTLQKF